MTKHYCDNCGQECSRGLAQKTKDLVVPPSNLELRVIVQISSAPPAAEADLCNECLRTSVALLYGREEKP